VVAVDIGAIRDLLIIILYSLITIIIIGAAIGAFIAYRKAKNAMEKFQRPFKNMQHGFAFVRGAIKGLGDSFDIFRGREVKHEDQTDRH